jgi:hypothetical protein
MAPRKGVSNNPKGKPKGTPTKKNQELREWVKTFLEGKTGDLEKEWEKLKPEQKFQLFERLLAYSLPKPQTIDLNLDLDFNRLSEEQLDVIIEGIMKKGE